MVEPDALLGGRYVLRQRIAGGGMGEVWRGEDTVLGRTVAVKVLLPALIDDVEFVARFRAEARAMAALSHPGIVDVYDYGHADSTAYLVMQYVEGQPLLAVLDRMGALDSGDVMQVVAQVAEALHAAHGAGIVHRDVKPANLLIRNDGRVVLTDFGIARTAAGDGLTEAGTVLGTASYVAPEQITGEPVTPATDVYALGVVAYECLTGNRPFEGNTPMTAAFKRVTDDAPDLPESFPEPVRRVVARALAREPTTRWPSAAALAEAAAAAADAIESAPTAAAPGAADEVTAPVSILRPVSPAPVPPAPSAPTRGAGGRRLVLAAAGLALVLLLTVGIAAALRTGRSGGDGVGGAGPTADDGAVGAAPSTSAPRGGRNPTRPANPGDKSTSTPPDDPPATRPGGGGAAPPPTPQPPPPPPVPPPPSGSEVPRVLGMEEAQARQLVEAAGLVPDVRYEKEKRPCLVFRQDPEPGTTMTAGGTVLLVVAGPRGKCRP